MDHIRRKQMKKAIIAIIIAILLIAAGGVICGVTFVGMGSSFEAMNFAEMETDTMKVTEAFTDIEVTADTGNVTIKRVKDPDCTVERYQDKKAPFEVSVKNGTLVISQKERDNIPWYERIGLLADMPKVVISLPSKDYGIFTATTDTGMISVEGKLSPESMSLTSDTGEIHIFRMECKGELFADTDTGNIEIDDVTCNKLRIRGETTNIGLENVIATGDFDIVTNSGNIRFEECDAESITAKTDTGSITGTLLSRKRFEAKTDTGSVVVPKDTDGGLCRLNTDTGDIRISIGD